MKLSETVTLEAAAAFLGCSFIGNPEHLITGVNEIHGVESGDLTFVDVEKYYKKALNSAATTIIINKAVEPPPGKGLIISEDPFTDYNRFTEYVQATMPLNTEGKPQMGKNVRIGSNVIFGIDVVIEDEVEIGHNCVIGSHVRIGKGSRIYGNVSILDHCQLGEYVCVNAGTVIGSEAFYFKSRPDRKDKMLTKGRVIIGDHVDIGANCTIDRGVSMDTTIGDWTKVDNLVQVGHDTYIGKRCIIAAQVGIAGVSIIEDDVMLWGQVGVNKDLTIGKGAQLYAQSGVMSSLEGGKAYFGSPAKEARKKMREEIAVKQLPDLLKKMRE